MYSVSQAITPEGCNDTSRAFLNKLMIRQSLIGCVLSWINHTEALACDDVSVVYCITVGEQILRTEQPSCLTRVSGKSQSCNCELTVPSCSERLDRTERTVC